MVLRTGFIYRQRRQCSKYFLQIQPGKYCRDFLQKHYRPDSVKLRPRKGDNFPGSPRKLGTTVISHASRPFKGKLPVVARCGFSAFPCCPSILQPAHLIYLIVCFLLLYYWLLAQGTYYHHDHPAIVSLSNQLVTPLQDSGNLLRQKNTGGSEFTTSLVPWFLNFHVTQNHLESLWKYRLCIVYRLWLLQFLTQWVRGRTQEFAFLTSPQVMPRLPGCMGGAGWMRGLGTLWESLVENLRWWQ